MNRRLALASVAALSLVAPSVFAQTAVVAVTPPPPPPAEGAAGELRLPVAQAERGITNPRFILSPEAGFNIAHVASTTFANLSVGASFSITDDLSVRALVLPLQLAGPAGSGFHYGQITGDFGPSVGATYRFVKGDVEVGASLDLGIITFTGVSGVTATPGVPVRFHATKSLRIDTGAYIPITNATVTGEPKSTTTAGLVIPASVLYDITEPIHVGVATGFTVVDLSNAGSTSEIPVGVFAGYAIAGKEGPILDIDPSFTFPALITPGGATATDTHDYVIGVTVGGFIYL